MTQVYNFSSGPAMLPVEVLRRAEQELCNWHGLGTSVMEISHRSKEFIAVAEQAEQDLRDLLKVPSNYKVLFCHGGARAQFAGSPGKFVSLKDTIRGFKGIMDGDYDHLPEQAFYMVGTIEEAVEKAKKL